MTELYIPKKNAREIPIVEKHLELDSAFMSYGYYVPQSEAAVIGQSTVMRDQVICNLSPNMSMTIRLVSPYQKFFLERDPTIPSTIQEYEHR